MKPYKLVTVVEADGTLSLRGLPFTAGSPVEVTVEAVIPGVSSRDEKVPPPMGESKSYRDEFPFEPTCNSEEWETKN